MRVNMGWVSPSSSRWESIMPMTSAKSIRRGAASVPACAVSIISLFISIIPSKQFLKCEAKPSQP